MIKRAYFILLLLPLFHSALQAKTYIINPDHSQILFNVTYLKVSKIEGALQDFTGKVSVGQKNIPTDIELKIKADSITTFDKKRDQHLLKTDFLAAAQHPFISFKASQEDKKWNQNLQGELEFLGKKHPLTLKIQFLGKEIDPWGKQSLFYSFETSLQREELGLYWNKVLDKGDFLIGQEIRVSGRIQLQPAGDKTPFSTHLVPGPPSGFDNKRQKLEPKSAEEIKETFLKTANNQKAKASEEDVIEQKNIQTSESPLRTMPNPLQWLQIGVLCFFALFGVISMGVGVKLVLEKKMPHGRFQLLGEAIFILLVFALSTSFYTLIKLLV